MRRYLQALWDKAEKANENNLLSMLEYNPNAHLLDCGCGNGKFTLKTESKIRTSKMSGIEIVKDVGILAEQKGVRVKQVDLNRKFPFSDETFDVILIKW